MLKRLELKQILFNEYEVDGFIMPEKNMDWTNMYADSKFDLLQEGCSTMLMSRYITESTLYNTCILQPGEERYIEFRALNNNDGTFTYIVLTPLTVNGICSYVPVLRLDNLNKYTKVSDTNFVLAQTVLDKLSKILQCPTVNLPLEHLKAYLEVLRIKLLIKESVRDNGYDIASIISVLALNTMAITYSSNIDHSEKLLDVRNLIRTGAHQDMFEAGATYLVIGENDKLSMPIPNATYIDGVIVLSIDPSRYVKDDLYVVTLGNNSPFSKLRVPRKDVGLLQMLNMEVAVGDREDMIEVELNPHLRKVFKLLNK